MSRVDAEQALAIYRNFCKQTERVVEYLGVAKKLQNLISVPIPNLKHVSTTHYPRLYVAKPLKAPVSLAGALQEYLDDPNFDQNMIEYRTNKDAVNRNKNSTVTDRTRKPDTRTC
jgi:phosphatidylinositol-binding clathrin assembly protein